MEGIKVIIRFGVAVAHYVGKFWTKTEDKTRDFIEWKNLFPTKISLKKLFKKAFTIRISWNKIRVIMEMDVRGDSLSDSLFSVDSLKDYHLGHNFFCISELSSVESRIFSMEELRNIWTWLPYRMLAKNPEIIFTTRDHGWSLKTFYAKCAKWDNVIVGYETTTGEKFGFFSSVELTISHGTTSFYGTGETFVFSISPIARKYPWVGINKRGEEANEMFIAGDIDMLIVGGGGGEAIFLQEDLFEGRSERCDTFDNDPLVEGSDFVCKVVEVLGLR